MKFRRFVTWSSFFWMMAFNSFSQTIYEAEDATVSGPSISTQYAGYSGTGYADYNNPSGDYVEFSLTASSAGSYPIAFRYANGGTGDRPLAVSVNGSTVISSLSFPATGAWTTWAFTATNNVTLNAGLNTIRITATGSSGGNVDYMVVTANGTQPLPPGCSIFWNNTQQHIDGFGFSSAWCGQLSTAKNNALYNKLGMSILRVRIDEGGAWSQETANSSAAHAAGATVLGSPWSAPIAWTSNGSNSGGYLLPSNYTNYVNWLSNAVVTMHLDYVSIQNEPDFSAWMNWSSTQIYNFMKTNASAIGKPVLMPESFHFSDSYSDSVINDPSAVTNFAILGGHFYGGGNYVHTNAIAHGKPVWMTEHYLDGCTTNFPVCLNFAKEINDAMKNQFSAYIAWWAQDGDTNINLANSSGTIFKDGYTLGQFAKFIRPGYYRVGTTSSGGGAQISAYKDLNSSNYVIVALNLGSTPITQQFNFNGFPTMATNPSVTPWITSYTQSLEPQSPITNVSSSFTYVIQPSNIVTFVSTPPVASPVGLVATAGNNQISLKWNAVSGVTNYNVKRATVSGGPYTIVANVSTTNYVNTGLSSQQTYYYVVSAMQGVGQSPDSLEANATTPFVTSMLPIADSYVENGGNANSNFGTSTNLLVKNNVTSGSPIRNTYLMFDVHALANVQNATITLVPNRVDDTTVKMYYGLASTNWTENGITWNNQPGGLGTFFATNTVAVGVTDVVDVTTFVKSQATNGGLLSIEITQPTNSQNGLIQFCSKEYPNSAWQPLLNFSIPANNPPSAPTGLVAVGSNGVVNLSWASSAGSTSYNIKRSLSSGNETTVTNVTGTSFLDTGLNNGTTYYYVVSATNSFGESTNSLEVSAMPIAPPSSPVGLSAVASNSSVILNWTPTSGATSYNVKRSLTSGSGYSTIANLAGTNYVDSVLNYNTTYYYVVSALNAGGEGGNSTEANATTAGLPSAMSVTNTSGVSLVMSADGSYYVNFVSPAWTFSGNLNQTLTNRTINTGTDQIGAYSEIAFNYTSSVPHTASIRLYNNSPVVTFNDTTLATGANDLAFPHWTTYPSTTSHLSFGNIFTTFNFSQLFSDSLWLFFNTNHDAFIITAATNYMVASTVRLGDNSISCGINSGITSLPSGFSHRVILTAQNGINNIYSTWGNSLMALSGKTTPANDATVELNKFGYWTDNGAAYYPYYNGTAPGIANTLLSVRDEFAGKGIPISYMQLDSWWYKKGPSAAWNDPNNGFYLYEPDPYLFTNGLAAFQQQLGVPLITHNRWVYTNSPYLTVSNYVASGTNAGNGVIIDSRFWTNIMTYLKGVGGITYEQDWLGFRGIPSMNLTDPPAYLNNMAWAAAANGINLQYCMVEGRDYLQGTLYTNLMTIRTSEDRFDTTRWSEDIYGSRLAQAVGIWPWTDVYMSTETMNLLVSTLSAGPVGTGDALGTVNQTNLLKSTRPDGVIVKPDSPLVPVDDSYVNDALGLAMPMVAAAYTDHTNSRAAYVFAYGQNANKLNSSFKLSDLGITNNAYVYDFFAATGTVLNAGGTFNFTTTLENVFTGGSYFVCASIGPSGVALIGDPGKFVMRGKKRISQLSDNGTLIATVKFATGEQAVTLIGYSPNYPSVVVNQGSGGIVSYNPTTGIFTASVGPDVTSTAVVQITTGGTPPPVPPTPTNLTAQTISSSQINLSWYGSSGATGYNLKRAINIGGPYTTIASSSSTNYSDTGLAPGKTYYYTVTAFNGGGESSNSPAVSASTIGGVINIVGSSSGTYTVTSGSGVSVGTFDLNDNANALVVGVYIDANSISCLTNLTTFGGVPPTGYIQTSGSGDREFALYWLNPNTSPGQTLVIGANASSNIGAGYLALQLSGVDTNTPVVMTGTTTTSANNVNITTTATNSLIVSFYSANDSGLTLTPSAPLTWIGSLTAINGGSGGGSLAIATNSLATAGTQNLAWTSSGTTANQGVNGLAFAPIITPINTAPSLSPVSNKSVGVGTTLSVTNIASDTDVPAQTLTFSLLASPTNAAINSSSGVISWMPDSTQANSTNTFTVKVADNGSPSMSATQSFVVYVNPLPQPQIPTVSVSSGQLSLQINGSGATTYQVQSSTNLVDWTVIFQTNNPSMPFTWSTGVSNSIPNAFYRIVAGPPF